MMFETVSDIFSTTVSTVYYSSQASSQQGGGSGSYLCQHARLNVKRLGRLVLRNQRYRVVHPHRVARGLVGSLQACQRKTFFFKPRLKVLQARHSSPMLPIVHPSPWMVGGQTMSVCWKGSAWVQSWVGRVCRGTLCCVRPGMLMVACW